MGRIKDNWIKFIQHPVVRIVVNKYVIATGLFLAIILFIDSDNLFRWGKEKYNVMKQEELIDYYQDQISKTDIELKQLTSDRDSLEKFAREKYYFQEKDEDVYLVEH